MESTQRRMIAVALLVCLFAVGMAGLLNYFKYRSTADRIVKDRLSLIGNSIEHNIQSSLAIGLQFSDIGTLTGMLERERDAEDLVHGIDVFDTDGKMLYSTDRLRTNRAVPAEWLAAAHRAGSADWVVHNGNDSAVGVEVANNFGLTIGYLALRYSDDKLTAAYARVGRDLALAGGLIFVLAGVLASLALMAVMRRLGSDVSALEQALKAPQTARSAAAGTGLFGAALRRFAETTRRVETEIAELRGLMQRGAKP